MFSPYQLPTFSFRLPSSGSQQDGSWIMDLISLGRSAGAKRSFRVPNQKNQRSLQGNGISNGAPVPAFPRCFKEFFLSCNLAVMMKLVLVLVP